MAGEKDDKNVLDDLLKGTGEAAEFTNLDKLITNVDALKESGKRLESRIHGQKAYGIDIGTIRIVSVKQDIPNTVDYADQLNAFVTVPDNKFVKDMLVKNRMNHTKMHEDIAVLGYNAQEFANIFNCEVRRPMKKGLITSDEVYAIPIMKEIINLVLPRPEDLGQNICFSVPAPEPGLESDLVFHEGIIRKYLVGMGYNAKSINEGMAVVLSELEYDNYTGIGISMGAGMCNICFSFLSLPVISFGISSGGDDIDKAVARTMKETVNRVRVIKEESLDFSRTPRNNLENALHIYHEDLVTNLLNIMANTFSRAEKLPRLSQAIPIVLSGGTCLPKGFKVKFEQLLKQVKMPIAISEVRVADDPLKATARGALIKAAA